MSGYLTQNLGELWLLVPGTDDLLLTGATTDDAGFSYTIKAQSNEATWDNPIPVDFAVQRWMVDGAVASTQGHSNREPFFTVVVSAETAADLAAGESALAMRANQPCLLRWIPPTGAAEAAASIFEIWTWHLEHTLELDDELRTSRRYGIRMTAKPWVRSEGLSTVAALPTVATPTVASIDTCTSTTGWTGAPNAATVSGGTSIREALTPSAFTSPRTYGLLLNRTGAVTVSQPYLAIDATFKGPLTNVLVFLDSVVLDLVATIGSTRYYAMPTGVTSFTTLSIDANFAVASLLTPTLQMLVNDVSQTNSPGGIGTHKMLSRSMDVGGAVKTSGSLQIASPSATVLGNVLVYTGPDDAVYTPPLRQYRTAGNTPSSDGTAVSGFHEPLVTAGTANGPITYTLPPGMPEATYAVIARVQFGAATSFPLTFSAMDAAGATVVASVVGTAAAGAAGVGWVVVGVISLPGVARPSESQLSTVVQLAAGNGAGTHNLDEVFLLDFTHGVVSLVLGSPVGFTNLWLDSPDVDVTNNRPQVYYGAQADRSDAGGVMHSQVVSLGEHNLDPAGTAVFTVTDNVNDAVVSASFFLRWHTHAGS